MKNFLLFLAFVAISASVAVAQTTPAQGAPKTEKKVAKAKVKKSKKVVAASYECPMKCEKPSAKPGKCGKCKMDLVEVKQKN